MADLFERMRQFLGVVPNEKESEVEDESYSDEYHDPYDDDDNKSETMNGVR